MSIRLRSVKWLVACIVAAFVAALAWITLEHLGAVGGSQESRAAAIVYGTVVRDSSGSHLVIDEIWKSSADQKNLSLGDTIPLQTSTDSSVTVPDKAVIFFTHPVMRSNGPLHIGSIAYVHDGRVGSSGLSFAEFKKACLASPGT